MRLQDTGYYSSLLRQRMMMTPSMEPMEEEQAAMGPYYGMRSLNPSADALQYYSTQIVPPQELFGLEGDTPFTDVATKIVLPVAAGAVMTGILLMTLSKPHPGVPKSHWLLKNKTAFAIGGGAFVTVGWMVLNHFFGPK